jgi:ABC-type multidrug transport system fused ATPase/permease subunit
MLALPALAQDQTAPPAAAPAALPQTQKKDTRTELTVSGSASPAGGSVTFTVVVTGEGGIPAGTVTFKDGESALHSTELSEGRAQWTTAALAAGQHIITAAYSGNADFLGSVSQPKPHLVQQKGRAVLALLAAIMLAALMVLLRRILFRRLLRPAARMLRALVRRLRSLLRLGGRASARQRPTESFLGLGVGAIAEGFTETEDAIAADFDTSSVRIERNSRLVCSWIRPHYDRRPDYHRDDAEEDFEKAKQLFAADVPLSSNPLNLYDDIHNAFIVKLFGKSDKPCFYILSEFRKAISANVLALTVTYTLIVSAVLIVNLTVPTSIEFYQRLGLGEVLPPTYRVPFLGVELHTATEINKLMFALVSCFLGFGLMWMFNNLAYEQSQRYNGQQMHTFLMNYLSDISNHFHAVRGSATQSVIREAQVEEMKRETVVWITDLHWMSIRMQFIKQFLRNILFQIHRNRAFALVIVPLFFALLLFVASWLLALFEILALGSNLHNYWFYPLFLWLLYEYGRYLTRALVPLSESINEDEYVRLRLGLIDAMSEIMASYAGQLDQFRTRFRPGQGPGSQ